MGEIPRKSDLNSYADIHTVPARRTNAFNVMTYVGA